MTDKTSEQEIAKLSFEEALTQLRKIVEELEQGEGKLEESIEAYQRGALLKKHCETKLREAQERIEKISLGPDGKPSGSEPLDMD
ncbi:exodeoxyribonuclease VII small subunit [Limibacillus halophilus]|jgi:exodeoxyribonuclease VII small subunit